MRPQFVRLLLFALIAASLCSCQSSRPSDRVNGHTVAPAPLGVDGVEESDAVALIEDSATTRTITPRSLIDLAFHLHPSIKSSYQRYKAEEARYDFFYVSRDTLTPQVRTFHRFSEDRDYLPLERRFDVTRRRDHVVEAALEKRFFNTTRLDIASGFEGSAKDEQGGYQPFIESSLRYPLGESREKLARASQDIVQRNDLNDALLDYIKSVRNHLEWTMRDFYRVVENRMDLKAQKRTMEELRRLRDLIRDTRGANSDDARRVQAELSTAQAQHNEKVGQFEISLVWLKHSMGIPFDTPVEVELDHFNPFQGKTHEELMEETLASDPEIATLQNALTNAESQLDLAQRGKWDIAMLLGGHARGRGEDAREGDSDWTASAGLDISLVDPRVTGSLERQASANIARFEEAIADRRRSIYSDTWDPLTRVRTLIPSREQRVANMARYERDYQQGLAAYRAGNLNIDDLLRRLSNLEQQARRIANVTQDIGRNIAELCAATGIFFEYIGQSDDKAIEEAELTPAL